MLNRNRKSFFYFPARDATLVYTPDRKVVEVYAHTLSTRAPLADVLSKHGFKMPLSNRPLNRSRYDLSPFALPLKDIKPRIDDAKVERLYLTEAKALLHHATDAVTLHIDSGVDLQDVIGGRWSDHPFSQPGAILGVTLVAELVLEGEKVETPLSIVLAEPGRCSLQGERDPRMRKIGIQLLEALGVLKPLHPGSGVDDPAFVIQVARLLEHATSPMDGFALHHIGIDIDRFADEGIIIEGDRITEKVVESAEGERFSVKLERCTDPNQVRYQDPLTGNNVVLSAKHARRWKVDLNWLREEIITALGSSLKGIRGKHLDEEPVFLGEVDIDGHGVALYFAARMSNDRQYAKVDAALRLRPRAASGIVLTTASVPFSFAGTNVIVAIEDVLVSGQSATFTGERIRDKIAASKRKGMWMGGVPPLGYDVDKRLLVINDAEAAVVRRIFEEMLTIGSPTQIAVNLTLDGITTKAWTTQDGQTRPGARIDKKYMHKLLRNRIYLGELSHKGSWFPGVHKAIIDPGLWGRVHEVLAKDGHTRSVETKIRSRTDALLRGLLYAPSGERMYPTYSRKNGRKYHYYVSKSEARFGAPGKSYERLPALEIEGAVVAQIRTVLTSPETVASVVRHIQRNGAQIDEATTVMAMGRLNNVWDQLFPVERHRIANLMIERIDLVHAGEVQGIKVKWREVGWNALIKEFAPDSIGAELLEVEA